MNSMLCILILSNAKNLNSLAFEDITVATAQPFLANLTICMFTPILIGVRNNSMEGRKECPRRK